MYGHGKSRLSHAEKTAYPVGRYVILGGCSKGGAVPYVRISPRFVVSKLISWQQIRSNWWFLLLKCGGNALFHKGLPVLTKYFWTNPLYVLLSYEVALV